MVGAQRRDNDAYNRVTSVLICRENRRSGVGCGHQFVMGLVAWNLPRGPSVRARPRDHRPSTRQLAEIRQAARGVWPVKNLQRGAPVNLIQDISDPEEQP